MVFVNGWCLNTSAAGTQKLLWSSYRTVTGQIVSVYSANSCGWSSWAHMLRGPLTACVTALRPLLGQQLLGPRHGSKPGTQVSPHQTEDALQSRNDLGRQQHGILIIASAPKHLCQNDCYWQRRSFDGNSLTGTTCRQYITSGLGNRGKYPVYM